MMQKSQDELIQKLSQCEFVSLTIDGWSSRRLLSMLGVIVNFMDTGGSLTADYWVSKYLRESIQEKIFPSL